MKVQITRDWVVGGQYVQKWDVIEITADLYSDVMMTKLSKAKVRTSNASETPKGDVNKPKSRKKRSK